MKIRNSKYCNYLKLSHAILNDILNEISIFSKTKFKFHLINSAKNALNKFLIAFVTKNIGALSQKVYNKLISIFSKFKNSTRKMH